MPLIPAGLTVPVVTTDELDDFGSGFIEGQLDWIAINVRNWNFKIDIPLPRKIRRPS
jgi:hypothetical protein